MFVAPFVLAAALGQCPEPPSKYGPPPCAAENVPGCLPGYVRDVDAWGRVIFRCDPSYATAQGAPPAPPQAYAQPQAYYPPRPPAPPPAPAAPPPPPPEKRGQFGLVLLPGGTTFDRNASNTTIGAVGIELRGPKGGMRLRGLYEYTNRSEIWDIGIKYDFNEKGEIRPFLGLSAGAADLKVDPGWKPSGAIFAGLDLYFARDVFVTLEVKQRGFTRDDLNGGWRGSALKQTSVFAGIGVYL
jgi:hypothetical protein